MAKARKAPRLWLRADGRRPPVWIVLDGGRQSYTSFGADEREKAEAFLSDYIDRFYPEGWQPKPPPMISEPVYRGVIYFVTTEETDNFPIKIGYTTIASFRTRMQALQIASPFKLICLKSTPGTRFDEIDMQMNFSHLAVRGEWFRRAPELMDHIESLVSS